MVGELCLNLNLTLIAIYGTLSRIQDMMKTVFLLPFPTQTDQLEQIIHRALSPFRFRIPTTQNDAQIKTAQMGICDVEKKMKINWTFAKSNLKWIEIDTY